MERADGRICAVVPDHAWHGLGSQRGLAALRALKRKRPPYIGKRGGHKFLGLGSIVTPQRSDPPGQINIFPENNGEDVSVLHGWVHYGCSLPKLADLIRARTARGWHRCYIALPFESGDHRTQLVGILKQSGSQFNFTAFRCLAHNL